MRPAFEDTPVVAPPVEFGQELIREVSMSGPHPALLVDGDSDEILQANEPALRRFGCSLDELRRMPFSRLMQDPGSGLSGWPGSQDTGSSLIQEITVLGRPLRMVIIPEAPHAGDKDLENQARWRILEMIAQNAPLEKTLEGIVSLVERRCMGVRAAVLRLEDGKFHCAAGPHVPAALLRAMDGLPIDTCPAWTALHSVSSIADEPRWSGIRAEAQVFGFQTCWSEPVLSPAGEVLGVLSGFLTELRSPDPVELRTLEMAGHIAGIAVEQGNLMADLWHQAHFDPVTRLPNRYLQDERLEIAIMHAADAGTRVGVLHIDIDRFQTIIDLLGRDTGDLVLEQVARRFESALPGKAHLARGLGRDFTVILPLDSGADDIVDAAERIRHTLLDLFAIQDHELIVSATIGYAIYPEHGAKADTLLRNAETATYHVRRLGTDTVQMFQDEMNAHTQQRVVIENCLSRALARGELRMAYQPLFDLRTGALSGAEALLRWKHPVIGSVSPSTFIPIAEESGIIVSIGTWVLEEVCRQAMKWRASASDGCPIAVPRIAVNVSPVQFSRDDFVDTVTRVLRETGLPASALELELTESCLVQDAAGATRRMKALSSIGFRIAMDDFGTGYSSLSYMSSLPFDTVKIDRSFVSTIVDAAEIPALIESIVSVCHAFDRKVVAEGIETAAQRDVLATLGCHFGQGFLLGSPTDADAFEATWIRPARNRHPSLQSA